VDNYVYIHNAFRNHLDKIIQLARANELARATKEYELWTEIMTLHARVEDEIFMPALEGRGFPEPASIEAAHHHLHEAMDLVRGRLEKGEQAAAVTALAALREVLMAHLLEEEWTIMPAMVEHFTVDELWALDSLIVNDTLGYCDKSMLTKVTFWWLGNISFCQEGLSLLSNFGKAAKLGSLTEAEWRRLVAPMLNAQKKPDGSLGSPLQRFTIEQIAGAKLKAPVPAGAADVEGVSRMAGSTSVCVPPVPPRLHGFAGGVHTVVQMAG